MMLWLTTIALAADPEKDGIFGNAIDGIVEGSEGYVWLAYIVTWATFALYAARVTFRRAA